jgi:hypothetical protein
MIVIYLNFIFDKMLCVFCIPDIISQIDKLTSGDQCELEIIATTPCYKCTKLFELVDVKLTIYDTSVIIKYEGKYDFTLGEIRHLLKQNYKLYFSGTIPIDSHN